MGFRYNWKRGGGETENESVIGGLSYFNNFGTCFGSSLYTESKN